MTSLSSAAKVQALNFINTTFDNILSELERRPYGKPEIVLQRVRSFDVTFNMQTQKLERNVTGHQVRYCWPGCNGDEAWRFTCVGKILSEIKVALESGHIVTKRDIFYRDPILFKNQQIVDKYIDDIAYTCRVTRSDLNVAASPHGLYIGLGKGDNTIYSIDEDVCDKQVSTDHLKWVLVVEKEATFKQLVEQRLHNNCSSGPGVIVTGRGYPDLATLRFVQTLSNRTKPPITVFGLFDADPDGLAILDCYRYGSRVMAQELEYTAINIIWLGVQISDVNDINLMPLTMRDRAKARIMLSKSVRMQELPYSCECCSMLQHMLMLNMKAEIQGLRNGSEALLSWLVGRMKEHQA